MVICAGLDLAAREHRPSGLAIIEAKNISELSILKIATVYRNREIVEVFKASGINVVAVDSPLSLPSTGRGYREVDLEMIKQSFRVLPPVWKYMRELTLRAQELVNALRNLGIEVIETHPLSALKSSRCQSLENLLGKIGLKVERCITKHEADAITAALVCVYYYFNRGVAVKAIDGSIVLLPPIC